MFKYTKSAMVAVAMLLPTIANAAEFTLMSTDISEGHKLSKEQVLNGFGCKGKNISPSLTWSNAPAGTKSFVITAYDPDAPTGSGWWHWVVFNIPSKATTLPRGAGSGKGLPKKAIQGRTDFGSNGFGGACPPPGEVHRYVFSIFALSTEKLDLDENASAALVGFMTRSNALAKATITATYTR